MKTMHGDMFRVLPDLGGKNGRALFCCTTNGMVRYDRLIMGAGAADQLATCYPGVRRMAGALLDTQNTRSMIPYEYGLLVIPAGALPAQTADLGLFQTKRYPRDASSLRLIQMAVDKLMAVAGMYAEVHLNYPGIGLGRLTAGEVYPLIQGLPDHVTVWTGGEDESQRRPAEDR